MSDATYSVGTRVVVEDVDTGGYKRRPDYAVGSRGVVERVHGIYPDLESGDEKYLYQIRFDPADLFEDPEENESIYLDLWEAALRPDPKD